MKNQIFEDSFCKVNPIQHLLEVDTSNINKKIAFKIYISLLYTIHNTTYIQNSTYNIQHYAQYITTFLLYRVFFLNKNRKITQLIQFASWFA